MIDRSCHGRLSGILFLDNGRLGPGNDQLFCLKWVAEKIRFRLGRLISIWLRNVISLIKFGWIELITLPIITMLLSFTKIGHG